MPESVLIRGICHQQRVDRKALLRGVELWSGSGCDGKDVGIGQRSAGVDVLPKVVNVDIRPVSVVKRPISAERHELVRSIAVCPRHCATPGPIDHELAIHIELDNVGGLVKDQRHVPPVEVVVELELLVHKVLWVLERRRAQRVLKPQRYCFQPHPVAGSSVVAEDEQEHAAGALGAGHVAIPPRHRKALPLSIREVHKRPVVCSLRGRREPPRPERQRVVVFAGGSVGACDRGGVDVAQRRVHWLSRRAGRGGRRGGSLLCDGLEDLVDLGRGLPGADRVVD
mmetsp:Transcript_7565/g.17793  ORF Transcript_7565/g.17793 Transcript_7565/m.17793 type:complete len:283 (+) Transcript_7565:3476-4324(+)